LTLLNIIFITWFTSSQDFCDSLFSNQGCKFNLDNTDPLSNVNATSFGFCFDFAEVCYGKRDIERDYEIEDIEERAPRVCFMELEFDLYICNSSVFSTASDFCGTNFNLGSVWSHAVYMYLEDFNCPSMVNACSTINVPSQYGNEPDLAFYLDIDTIFTNHTDRYGPGIYLQFLDCNYVPPSPPPNITNSSSLSSSIITPTQPIQPTLPTQTFPTNATHFINNTGPGEDESSSSGDDEKKKIIIGVIVGVLGFLIVVIVLFIIIACVAAAIVAGLKLTGNGPFVGKTFWVPDDGL